MDLIFERGAKRRVKCPEAPTESWPADMRSELRQILPMHIVWEIGALGIKTQLYRQTVTAGSPRTENKLY